ncbi:hypothetical protein [Thetidibacter halocola]|uniref:Uncharacterized protein n=1 Tax=Thetidibacter halocola TaxID=2827239 RepID=A0A8J8BAA1_9RHOB|nr:hypothetical protein [Thetidibacter halocola]MBS0126330.1 hypothetical protein [Thetidibacter halocola]
MKTLALTLLVSLALAGAARADCFVEYKAKQDDPLRLHYGILALPGGCPSAPAAQDAAARRLAAGGWTLLTVLGVSAETPPDQKKANAGDFYLRF